MMLQCIKMVEQDPEIQAEYESLDEYQEYISKLSKEESKRKSNTHGAPLDNVSSHIEAKMTMQSNSAYPIHISIKIEDEEMEQGEMHPKHATTEAANEKGLEWRNQDKQPVAAEPLPFPYKVKRKRETLEAEQFKALAKLQENQSERTDNRESNPCNSVINRVGANSSKGRGKGAISDCHQATTAAGGESTKANASGSFVVGGYQPQAPIV
ncbi:histone acetyltransferase HAC1-like protein [Corchorus olitorius]|uniref:Histone acetyltransferase HAC1-like protein n=1 Tax=Corchorus olitorius TaxID=93759 RepID=A0A1R3GE54_9ROSI|nr:histone acetyltransferase HAC1-like protein [Corchorus olitorius]